MALVVCPLCVREDDIVLVGNLPDGRKEARCEDCSFTFAYGTPPEPPKPAKRKPAARSTSRSRATGRKPVVVSTQIARRRFPTAADRSVESVERAQQLKANFLSSVEWKPDPLVDAHWKKFQWVFSEDGLAKAVISDLLVFVHDPLGGSTGETSEFDKAWKLVGEFEGDRRVRSAITHLLRGPGDLEDRFSAVVNGEVGEPMPGFGESVLTKALAVTDPLRFLPVFTYADKRSFISDVYGMELPDPDEASMTIGRVAVWSNDLLVELLGDDFADQHHAAEFLRWARGQ